ncbi:MAG: hypothetical protein KF718_31445 [Polyangiaceae bacterium]|nr:hypothetical protein [Polyangiaceae bacterium]
MSAKSEKIGVSLDRSLLARAERLRQATGETRSALLSRALRQLLQLEAYEREVERYVAAYRAMPETSREIGEARKLARRAIADLPWDET